MHYDCIIIGAGMSGLSAGIRLAHYGKKVCIFERHVFPGGLNSYYPRRGHFMDVGLHAMTNYVPDGKDHKAPLNLLLRQLRLRREELALCPQSFSLIRFPQRELRITNDLKDLMGQVRQFFPEDHDGLTRFVEWLTKEDVYHGIWPPSNAADRLAEYVSNPLLRDMLLFPVMVYGCPQAEQMDFQMFCILFKSIFLEGLARPKHGIKPLLDTLVERFRANGGELALGRGVHRLHGEGNRLVAVELDNGEVHTAESFVSCLGIPETMALCDDRVGEDWTHWPTGSMGFMETIFQMTCPPCELGLEACVTFCSLKETFRYQLPADGEMEAYVLCVPDNYVGCGDGPAARQVRIAQLTRPAYWLDMEELSYRRAKEEMAQRSALLLDSQYPGFMEHVDAHETFTPKTIRRYTGKVNGVIYGSVRKSRTGETPWENAFVCGTDQGLVGIVGALISGAAASNRLLTSI